MGDNFERYEEMMRRAMDKKRGSTREFSKSICPAFYGKKCKLCERADHVYYNTEREDPLHQRAYDLRAKSKYYLNIITTDEPSKVQILEAGPKIVDPLVNYQMGSKKDYKDFMHPKRGRNIYIDKEGGVGARNATYDPTPRANISPLPDMNVLKHMYNLDEIDKLILEEDVKVIRPSRWEEGTMEVRVLPNWHYVKALKDPEFKKKYLDKLYQFFFIEVLWHMGISDEELELYNTGQIDPFGEFDDDEGIEGEAPTKAAKKAKSNPKKAKPKDETPEPDTGDVFDEDEVVDETDIDDELFDDVVDDEEEVVEDDGEDADDDLLPVGDENPCFGNGYDPDDELCQECNEREACSKAMKKKK